MSAPTDARALHLARFMNTRDGAESGTVAWDDLDDAGRESYLTDATLVIKALAHIDAFLAPADEWEYALRGDGDDEPYSDCSDDLDWLLDGADLVTGESHVVRRRKAGLWELVDVTEAVE